ncbi:nitrogen fixation protein NifX [Frankia sp. Cppng1_Ct_nod]|uniref:nitrogen fixation protein NifX n=1 Tax=Frankia sp. Cppng1_Ct_nod TaxID=2897162 RepID=UPI0010413B08|nr:nitrogen fixation protein NifX [Frankia sp. Cppng1_Ct_nod]
MLKVAFATGDGTVVDQHFGSCRRFDVYEVSADLASLYESRVLGPAADDEATKIDSRLDAVRDCAILHVCAIGGTAAAKVVRARVHPLKVAEDTAITDLIVRLQNVLAGNPPPWLRKLLREATPGAASTWSPR